MSAWLIAFGFTQAIEMPIYLAALRRRWPLRLALAFLPTLVTHPFVWFGFVPLRRALGIGYPATVVIVELFAIGVEAVILWRLAVRRPLLVSLLANLASVSFGFASRALFGVP
ncbi:MAG: hypothetical protein KC731_13695 [Myxococcales bacterium]|nr:hypothetical protein [Myxococcales bacterium]